MKTNRYVDFLSLSLFLVSIFFLSCSKNEDPAPSPVSPVEPNPQPERLALVSHTDGETYMTDSVELVFNKEIKVNYIKSKYEFCVTNDMGFVYINNGHGIRFKYGCAELGRSYPFEYSVTDLDGNTLIRNINIDFFTRKFFVDGYSVSAMITSPDSRHVWIIDTKDDGSFTSFKSLTIDSLITEIDVPIPSASSHIAYNPYNHLIYISSVFEPEIYVVDPTNGKFIKTIDITDLARDYSYTERSASNIFFMKNGFGVVNMAYGWLAIDSAKDDIVYIPQSGKNIDLRLYGTALINNGTQVVGNSIFFNAMGIIDQDAKDFIAFLPPRGDPTIASVASSKVNDMLLMMGNYTIVINTKTNVEYRHTYAGFFNYGFTNWSRDSPTLYGHNYNSWDGYVFLIFDYIKGQNVFEFPRGINMVGGEATTDGNYLVCLSEQGVFTFSKKMFQK